MTVSRHSLAAITVGALFLAAVSAAIGYWAAQSRRHYVATPANDARQQHPLYWFDPMQPDQHFDRPGKSPFMDMQLVPKYADERNSAPTSLEIDPAVVQNLGIRLARVGRGLLPQTVSAVGSVGFNQRDIAVIQARSSGFVTRVYGRAPGDVIRKNAPIVDLLVPEWAAAQTEFLALLKNGDHELTQAARQRMVLLGMPSDLIQRIEVDHELRTTITVRSPLAGMIDTLEAREGMAVSPGATLAKINGLATVWIEAALPEARGDLTQPGKRVEARVTAYSGQRFTGRVVAVLARADSETHTVRIRIELVNAGGRLRPGMFAQVRFASEEQIPVVYVASEAVIRTGPRAVVIVAGGHGRFIPTEVQVGDDIDGKAVILEGLTEGQSVVASGQFLIDSEANLKGVLTRLAPGSQP